MASLMTKNYGPKPRVAVLGNMAIYPLLEMAR